MEKPMRKEEQFAVADLFAVMGTKYMYTDAEMSALLYCIYSHPEGLRDGLFTQLITLHGCVKKLLSIPEHVGSIYRDVTWTALVRSMDVEYAKIQEKVLGSQKSLEPGEVGKLVHEAIERQRKPKNRIALLSQIIRYGEPRFVPYIRISDLAIKAKLLSDEGLERIKEECDNFKMVRAIVNSPMTNTPLLQAVEVLRVIEGIDDPLKKAVVVATWASIFHLQPQIQTTIIGIDLPEGMEKMLGQMFEIKR